MAVFSVVLYVCILPMYIYIGTEARNVTYVFVAHILFSILGSAIISEVLSNYRYVLLGLYGSFCGFFMTTILVILFYLHTDESKTALFGLIGVVIVANLITHTIRAILEYAYYHFYKMTGWDQM